MASSQSQVPESDVASPNGSVPTGAESLASTSGTQERVLSTDSEPGSEMLELLSDEYSYRLLEAISEEPRCARELAKSCDMSRVTAYRRLNQLEDIGLVSTGTELHPDGHHRTVFESRLERVEIDLMDDDQTLCVELHGSDGSPAVPVSAD